MFTGPTSRCRSYFRDQLWPLLNNVTAVYGALLRGLTDFALTSQSIRADVGDGTLAGYNVNFWMFQTRVLTRIRVDHFEMQFNGILDTDVDLFETAFGRLIGSLATVSESFLVSNYIIDLRLHGATVGIDPREYVSRFITAPEGLPGPYLGAGVVFYYGEHGVATTRSVTADLSGVVPGDLFVRMYSGFAGSVDPMKLRAAFGEHLAGNLQALGLTTGESKG